jgi:acetyl-CoA C-acetyltransferase
MSDRNKDREAVILGAARTPTGRFMSAFAAVPATVLGTVAVKAAVERSGVDPGTVYEVIMGLVVGAGAGQAPGRQAALGAGLPDTVGATAVNKVCGSGLKSVMMAANAIAGQEAEVFVVGGMESMSQAPFLLPKARGGMGYGHGQVLDSVLHDGLWCQFQDWVMGNGAEFIARHFEITPRGDGRICAPEPRKGGRGHGPGRLRAGDRPGLRCWPQGPGQRGPAR